MKGYKHLTEFDRNKIARMRKEGATMREIGAALHVSAATVCREIKRGTYTYMNADYIEVTEYIPERSQARYRANMAAKGGPLKIGSDRRYAETLEALIAHRYEVMAGYARGVRQACQDEMAALQARQADVSVLRAARRWLHRDTEQVPRAVLPHLAQVRAAHPVLDQMVTMREELRQLWLNTSHSREQLTADLQAWCQRAEASGITALREFSLRLRAAQPV